MEKKHCVICYTSVIGENDQVKTKSETKGNAVSETEAVLRDQLAVIFLLRKFIRTPQNICVQFLKKYGNPCEWVFWCHSCSSLVDKAQEISKQITLLQKQFQVLQADLKTAVELSENQIVRTKGRLQKDSKWGPTEIIRSSITKEQTGYGHNYLGSQFEKLELKIETPDSEDERDGIHFQDDYYNSISEELERPMLPLEDRDNYSAYEEHSLQLGNENNSEMNSGIELRKKSKRDSKKNKTIIDIQNSEDSDHSDVSWTEENGYDSEESYKPDRQRKRAKCSNASAKEKLGGKGKGKIFKCKRCPRAYRRIYTLKEHFINVHGELPITCRICNQKLINEHDLEIHNRKYHNQGHTVSCSKCTSKTFMTEKSLKQHCRKEHADDFYNMFPPIKAKPRCVTLEESVECKICGNRFIHLGSLRAHCKRFHPDDYDDVFPLVDQKTCTICNKKFEKRYLLKSHYEEEHPKEFKWKYFPSNGLKSCPDCSFTTYKHKEYQIHINKHAHVSEKKANNKPIGKGKAMSIVNEVEISSEQEFVNDVMQQDPFLISMLESDLEMKSEAISVLKTLEHESSLQTAVQESPSVNRTKEVDGEINNHQSQKCQPPKIRKGFVRKKVFGKKMFKCDRCPRLYGTIYTLKQHFLSSHGEFPISCDRCNEKCVNESDLKSHRDKSHNESHTVSCPKCVGKTFKEEKSLRQHCRKEHPEEYRQMFSFKRAPQRYATSEEDTVSCEKCERRFIHLGSLRVHFRMFHPEAYPLEFDKGDKTICGVCQEKFSNRSQVKAHYEKEHPKEYKLRYYEQRSKNYRTSHKCPHCPYIAPTKRYLRVHINVHTNERPYVCEFCGCTFRNIQMCRNHRRSKHYEKLGLGVNPLMCQDCGKAFETPAYLKLHVRSFHHGEFKLHCQVCNRGFNNPSTLQLHLKRHRGEKSELCAECGATFVAPSQLRSHIRIVHEKEKNFLCKLCPKKFCSSTRLRRHEQGVHSDGTKPFQCKVCQKRFPVRNYLYIHMRSHRKRGEVDLAPQDGLTTI